MNYTDNNSNNNLISVECTNIKKNSKICDLYNGIFILNDKLNSPINHLVDDEIKEFTLLFNPINCDKHNIYLDDNQERENQTLHLMLILISKNLSSVIKEFKLSWTSFFSNLGIGVTVLFSIILLIKLIKPFISSYIKNKKHQSIVYYAKNDERETVDINWRK